MNKLIVTIDEQRSAESGVAVEDMVVTLGGIQAAMRLMVQHLGGRRHNQGRLPNWVKEQSVLRLVGVRPGSFVAELVLEPPSIGQGYQKDYSVQALDAFREWDGGHDSTLPDAVIRRLQDMAGALSDGTSVWVGAADDYQRG